MTRQILVALNSQDRLSQMLPYIEEIAQPGMKVVFLIRFAPQAVFNASRHSWLAASQLEEARFAAALEEPTSTGGNFKRTHSMNEQGLMAEHKVFLALEALLRRGIETTVDVYTGSLRSVVKSYTRNGKVHLIMKPAGRAFALIQLLLRAFPIFALINEPSFSPIRLHLTNQAAS